MPGGQSFVQRQTPERLARDRRRLARILPGRSFTVVGYDDLPARLEELGGTAQVVAISYGGLVALRAAAARPDLVARLVLLSSAHEFSTEGRRRVERQIDFAQRGDLAGLVEDFVTVFRRPWLNWLLRLRVRMSGTASLNDPAVIVRGLRAVLDDPLTPADLARIAAPALIIGGTRDQFFGDGTQERTASLLPNATVALADGETHMLAVERAAFVTRTLSAFLR